MVNGARDLVNAVTVDITPDLIGRLRVLAQDDFRKIYREANQQLIEGPIKQLLQGQDEIREALKKLSAPPTPPIDEAVQQVFNKIREIGIQEGSIILKSNQLIITTNDGQAPMTITKEDVINLIESKAPRNTPGEVILQMLLDANPNLSQLLTEIRKAYQTKK